MHMTINPLKLLCVSYNTLNHLPLSKAVLESFFMTSFSYAVVAVMMS